LPSAKNPQTNPAAPLSSLDAEGLDRIAWRAICEWPAHGGVPVVHDGLDFALLTRWFLWDKVGRAIRRQTDPERFALEQRLLDEARAQRDRGRRATREATNRLLGTVKRAIAPAYYGMGRAWRNLRAAFDARGAARAQVLYVPLLTSRLNALLSALRGRNTARLAANYPAPAEISGARVVASYPKAPPPDATFLDGLYGAIPRGLAHFGIRLLDEDGETLRGQILEQALRLKQIEIQLRAARPAAILVHGDNHPPHQDYVLAARREGIASIMIQHGLDCERSYLDDAYAGAIAVWGDARHRRYLADSARKPALCVTGNPAFDARALPSRLNNEGAYWLWLTRPHAPDKCYAPSRRPSEGLEILESLMAALRERPSGRLIIKPHPYDYAELYRDRAVADPGLAARIEVSNRPIEELVPGAGAVISEDSTAGMEAMFWGKPLVLAHFAPSSPATPFVESGAALPGFSDRQLRENAARAGHLSGEERKRMLEGQRAFLLDHAGPCDGQAARRAREFVAETLAAAKGR